MRPGRASRIFNIILAAFGSFIIVTVLQRLLGGSLRPPFFTISPSEANPPTPQILTFWETWAEGIDAARPRISAIELEEAAQPAGIEPENERERKPFNLSIGIPDKDIQLLRQSHERLIGHASFSRVNEQAKRLFSGTGVVTVAGGSYFAPAILSIRMLRKTKLYPPGAGIFKKQSRVREEDMSRSTARA